MNIFRNLSNLRGMFGEGRFVYRDWLAEIAQAESAEWDDPDYPERGSDCALGGAVDLTGKASKEIVQAGLRAVTHMPHRVGYSYDDRGRIISADGAGVLVGIVQDQIAHMLLTERDRRKVDDPKRLQVGMFNFRRQEAEGVVLATKDEIERCFTRYGFKPLGWTHVETDESSIVEERMPQMRRYEMLAYLVEGLDRVRDVRDAFRIGRRINGTLGNVRIDSLALDRVVFKGQLTPQELVKFFPMLNEMEARYILIHGRYATNVLGANPQPFGTLAHNGEINSISGNRKRLMDIGIAAKFSHRLLTRNGSDSAHLNDALDLMLANGVPLPEAVMRLIPPALRKIDHPGMRDFVHASKRAMGGFGMWEGPCGLMAADGRHVVAHLDRLGLRPLNEMEIDDGNGKHWVTWASEKGAFDVPFSQIATTGQLEAGGIRAVDLETGELLGGDALYERILSNTGLNVGDLNARSIVVPDNIGYGNNSGSAVKLSAREILLKQPNLRPRLAGFGWKASAVKSATTRIEEIKPIITSLGFHDPLPILDPKLANLFDLYLQRAAIITNPPFDQLGESDVVETDIYLGPMPKAKIEDKAYKPIFPQWALKSPIVPSQVLEEIKAGKDEMKPAKLIDASFVGIEYADFYNRINEIVDDVITIAEDGDSDSPSVIVLSDKDAFNGEPPKIPIHPSILVRAIHTLLVNKGIERNISVVVESGYVRSGHDMGVLIAHGASGVCPYMLDELAALASDPEQARHNSYSAEQYELVKMMSKLGITTTSGARYGYWFSAVGLAPEVASRGGAKISSKVDGLDLRGVFEHLVKPQMQRFGNAEQWMKETESAAEKDDGAYEEGIRKLLNMVAFPNREGLKKLLSREECPKLHSPAQISDKELSDIAFKAACKRRGDKLLCLRDLLTLHYKHAEDGVDAELLSRAPTIEQILKRFVMSHMSMGALGPVAHRAIAMGCNLTGLCGEDFCIPNEEVDLPADKGVQSASGEGGEEEDRVRGKEAWLSRSRSKQIGTAGWGVDVRYLMEADEICIKIAQGAKPGEGGDLLGQKVNTLIASIRHVRIGTRLISPPPNHDIYSIEDLKGRIRGLRALNPKAKISLKVAAMPDLGDIMVGAVKSGADVIEISGFDGSTGASGEQSIKYTGLPVEISAADVHQALVRAGVRDRVVLRADGKIMTAKDFVKMLSMGMDGVGLGTLLMIFVKCIACHSCHTNRCPTGITTTEWGRIVSLFVKGELDEKRDGLDKAVIQHLIETGAKGVFQGLQAFARQVQFELARMGVTAENFDQLIGDAGRMSQQDTGNPVVDSLDLSFLLTQAKPPEWKDASAIHGHVAGSVRSVYENALGDQILKDAEPVLSGQMKTIELHYETDNTNREIGVSLAGQVYERLIRNGKLTDKHRVVVNTHGFAGHNYGFAACDGMTFLHEGFLNDSVGQYASGDAKIVVKAPNDMKNREGQALVGNACGMCATGSTIYVGGKAGERFGIRNSGATLVAEAALDYPFEYQVAGCGVLLGDFVGVIGSRMTGGEIFFYDPDGDRKDRVAKEYIETVNMKDADFERLHAEIEAYYQDTLSVVAERILANWDKEKLNFVRAVTHEDAKKGGGEDDAV